MVLEYLDHCAGLVPLCRVATGLVLDQHRVSAFEGRQALGVFVPPCAACDGSSGHSSLPAIHPVCPLGVWSVLARDAWE